MNSDRPRALLLELVRDRQTDLKAVSLAIGRNHAYLHQYINRNVPRTLPEDVREALAGYFGVDPDAFRAKSKPPEPEPYNLSRDEKVREIAQRVSGLDDATLDAVLHIVDRVLRPEPVEEPEATPESPPDPPAIDNRPRRGS